MDYPEDINCLEHAGLDNDALRHIAVQNLLNFPDCQDTNIDLPGHDSSCQRSFCLFHNARHIIQGEVPETISSGHEDDDDEHARRTTMVRHTSEGPKLVQRDSMSPQHSRKRKRERSSTSAKSHNSSSEASSESSYVSLRDLGVPPPGGRSVQEIFDAIKIMFLKTWTFPIGRERAVSEQEEPELSFFSPCCEDYDCRCMDPVGCDARGEYIGMKGCSC